MFWQDRNAFRDKKLRVTRVLIYSLEDQVLMRLLLDLLCEDLQKQY